MPEALCTDGVPHGILKRQHSGQYAISLRLNLFLIAVFHAIPGEGADSRKGPKGTAVETVDVQWHGEVRAFTAQLLLRDGIMQMSKDLG